MVIFKPCQQVAVQSIEPILLVGGYLCDKHDTAAAVPVGSNAKGLMLEWG